MATHRIFESGDHHPKQERRGLSIAPGTVTNDCDLIMQGKVKVHVPQIGEDIWARLVAIGAGPSRGFMFAPQMDDEVLVAFNNEDHTDAFLIGGLWNNNDRLPTSNPLNVTEPQTRRTIRTGLAGAPGHSVEFDDLAQGITIETSTKQKIVLGLKKIEITTTGDSMKIEMDLPTQAITLTSGASTIKLDTSTIKLDAPFVEINGAVLTVAAKGTCTINGAPVKIN